MPLKLIFSKEGKKSLTKVKKRQQIILWAKKSHWTDVWTFPACIKMKHCLTIGCCEVYGYSEVELCPGGRLSTLISVTVVRTSFWDWKNIYSSSCQIEKCTYWSPVPFRNCKTSFSLWNLQIINVCSIVFAQWILQLSVTYISQQKQFLKNELSRMMRKQIQQYKTLKQKQWGSSKRLTDGLRNISVQIKFTTSEFLSSSLFAWLMSHIYCINITQYLWVKR